MTPWEDGSNMARANNAESRTRRAPLRLMAQFLRAVSEDRMEDGLALAQTSDFSSTLELSMAYDKPVLP